MFSRKADKLIRDPDTMRGAYENIITEKRNSLQQYMNVVADKIALNDNRLSRITALTEDVSKLERVMAGALARAKKRQETLIAEGKSADEISHDEEMILLRAAYADASSTSDVKKERIKDIENEIKTAKLDIDRHRRDLQKLQKEITSLNEEKIDAIADIQSAEHDIRVNNTNIDIINDKTEEELESLRAARSNAKGRATIAREMAGNQYDTLEEELASIGEVSQGAIEFDKLLAGDTIIAKNNKEEVLEELELDLGKTS